uniref:Uncharacterized protein n=1 Tax=Junco hyemalis TaxID=40217 RepID=A0A8C5NK67_JUNHY
MLNPGRNSEFQCLWWTEPCELQDCSGDLRAKLNCLPLFCDLHFPVPFYSVICISWSLYSVICISWCPYPRICISQICISWCLYPRICISQSLYPRISISWSLYPRICISWCIYPLICISQRTGMVCVQPQPCPGHPSPLISFPLPSERVKSLCLGVMDIKPQAGRARRRFAGVRSVCNKLKCFTQPWTGMP